ncbi:hypothetical protein ACFTZF_35770 [Streptomyces mirabilis]|uniref:hypothetical protein n=1 Tax=Streptomyces mirabilis TaxID=68239 RepID=UPI00362FDA7A
MEVGVVAVAAAYGGLGNESRLAEMSGTSAATASASGKDGIANRKDAQERASPWSDKTVPKRSQSV